MGLVLNTTIGINWLWSCRAIDYILSCMYKNGEVCQRAVLSSCLMSQLLNTGVLITSSFMLKHKILFLLPLNQFWLSMRQNILRKLTSIRTNVFAATSVKRLSISWQHCQYMLHCDISHIIWCYCCEQIIRNTWYHYVCSYCDVTALWPCRP